MNNPTKLLNTDIIAVDTLKETKICDCDFFCGYCKELFNLDPNLDYELLGESTEDVVTYRLLLLLNMSNTQFRSLLQASGLNWVNPIEKPQELEEGDWDCIDWQEQRFEWQEAESKLIKGKLIFLKIIK